MLNPMCVYGYKIKRVAEFNFGDPFLWVIFYG
jgi:hypothetical protein